MKRMDLMMYSGVMLEYRPRKPKHRTMYEVLGISGVELAMMICFVTLTAVFLVMFIGWWFV